MKLPHWIQNGRNFIWYRKGLESRQYWNHRWVHYLTIGRPFFEYTFKWETIPKSYVE